MMTPQQQAIANELTARRVALALQVEIPNMAAYALEWSKLAADFEAVGWKANAEICRSNAKRYSAYDEGAYQRMLEEIPARLEPARQWSDPSERMLYCGECDTWTKHVRLDSPGGEHLGWMCGCGEFVEVHVDGMAVR